ncbi:ricin-type beta-trefoil lectin domain protein [Actinoplanes hulinensis]|uniref:Ricin-type beta-trefoil lectin domain protein n=1 Tax=Actinoplanes hulinensis TaxID=1144547 RepID=A0ABS7B8J5_9ACTN|nr:RICIN domain-containing protein [Actinoplanes hulinensis]MBW6437371.1 ricin-type beta-trefoil lectin domain protein [Actinoplanes hulinensis]
MNATASAAPSVSKSAEAPAPPISLLPSSVATGNGLLVTGNGLCLDLRGGSAEDNQEVHVDDCNGTSPQRWQLNADRTLEVLDMCAYLVGDGTVHLTRCDTRTTAQWQLFENGVLRNVSNGQCLTDPHSGAQPARAVVVTTCVGGNNQRWTFR